MLSETQTRGRGSAAAQWRATDGEDHAAAEMASCQRPRGFQPWLSRAAAWNALEPTLEDAAGWEAAGEISVRTEPRRGHEDGEKPDGQVGPGGQSRLAGDSDGMYLVLLSPPWDLYY